MLEMLIMLFIFVIVIFLMVFIYMCRKIIFGEKFVNIERRYKWKIFDGIEFRIKLIFLMKIYFDYLERY